MKIHHRFLIAAAAIGAVLALPGCATDFGRYADGTVKIAQSADAVKGKRFEALGALGCTTTYTFNDKGDKVAKQEVKCDPEAAKFAAFALAVSGMQQAPDAPTRLEAPYSLGQGIRDIAGLIVPLANVGAQIYGVQKNAQVAITQSNNSAAVAVSTNNTMASIAGSGLAAATTLGSRPTTVVNGNGNAVNGSNADNSTHNSTHNTNNCPGAPGGNGGTSGNGGSSGSATTGSAGTGGSSAGGNGAPSGAVNCTAGK